MNKELNDLTDYFFEAGQLKYVKRTGWWVVNVKDTDSVAEHSHRTSIIAFVLAVGRIEW